MFPRRELVFQRHNILSVLFGIHLPELTLHGRNFASMVFVYHQHLPDFLCFNLSPNPDHLLLSKAFGFRVVGCTLPSESALQVVNCANAQVIGCAEYIRMNRMQMGYTTQFPLKELSVGYRDQDRTRLTSSMSIRSHQSCVSLIA